MDRNLTHSRCEYHQWKLIFHTEDDAKEYIRTTYPGQNYQAYICPYPCPEDKKHLHVRNKTRRNRNRKRSRKGS